VHEVKFDGYRMQVQKAGDRVRVFNRQGQDCTHRHPLVAEAGASLPAFSAVVDCELVAMGETREDFWGIRSPHAFLQVVCFDLMVLETEDLRGLPLLKRKAKLRSLVSRSRHPMLAYSDHFTDAATLLAKAEAIGLEGIVSKRCDGTYRKGSLCGWKKVKTAAWLKANANRPEAFAKGR
jgi:bifunctional non-homologous end joining protein LigD